MLPWSVSATAGMSSALAFFMRSTTLIEPSSRLYSECACRCTKGDGMARALRRAGVDCRASRGPVTAAIERDNAHGLLADYRSVVQGHNEFFSHEVPAEDGVPAAHAHHAARLVEP